MARASAPSTGRNDIDAGHQRVMQSSTGGFVPTEAAYIRDSELCATCHTLYTTALGKNGEAIGSLPEQMPFLEWRHSDYPAKNNLPVLSHAQAEGETPVMRSSVLRQGARHHNFVGANFFMQRIPQTFARI